MLAHLRRLSVSIGGRGSCTPAEREAGEYVANQLKSMGVQAVGSEPFQGAPSTYRPFLLSLGAALLGSLGAIFGSKPVVLAAAALLNALGVWGMLAESDLASNWTRLLLPRASSQNIVGQIAPAGPVRHRAVLCAHVDTHRTPVFYSSRTWHRLFGLLVSGIFLSIVAGALVFTLGALFGWAWVRWLAWIVAPVQAFAFFLCLSADFTPFSPGANDNASGVAAALDLARRLCQTPLANTEVRLAFTGCEEVGSYGMQAYLDAHARDFGPQTVYIILDEVGVGCPKIISAEGLIRKHNTHPRALDLARRAASALPGLGVVERAGEAYTDALPATQRGLIALTLSNEPQPGAGEVSHWHQMSDTIAHIDPQTLAASAAFSWQVLKLVDQA